MIKNALLALSFIVLGITISLLAPETLQSQVTDNVPVELVAFIENSKEKLNLQFNKDEKSLETEDIVTAKPIENEDSVKPCDQNADIISSKKLYLSTDYSAEQVYTLKIGQYLSKTSAETKAMRLHLAETGFKHQILETNDCSKKRWFLLLLGDFPTIEEANQASKKLKKGAFKITSSARRLPPPEPKK